ncbi:MAG: sensor histidine kinase, partial [Candidatus Thorarchaeota archaeon]
RRNAEINTIAIAETSKLYLDIMGHDIRNHLQAIIMSSDIIESNDIGDEVTSAIEMIVESVQKSKDLISKIHADKELLNVPLSNISLTVALEHSINSLLEVYDDIKLNVEYNVQESLITADKYVERLLSNILENAVIHNSGAIKQIWVELREVDRGYLVSIKDNGPGISDGMKETLFDPSRRFGGIGVHQVTRILRKYGGNISVHDRVPSDSSQGARFDIWFPKALTSV